MLINQVSQMLYKPLGHAMIGFCPKMTGGNAECHNLIGINTGCTCHLDNIQWQNAEKNDKITMPDEKNLTKQSSEYVHHSISKHTLYRECSNTFCLVKCKVHSHSNALEFVTRRLIG